MEKLANIITFRPLLFDKVWGGHDIPAIKGIGTDLPNVGESWEVSAVPGKPSLTEADGVPLTELVAQYGVQLLGTRSVDAYGMQFPLLVKVIDAADDLSVQVHPSDRLAEIRHNSLGKTEMWYVIKTRPDAKIYAGLKTVLTPADYRRMVQEGTFDHAVAAYTSKPGDSFFIPAGRVHAIGAGNVLIEIQESSDVTYRIYDYNRPGLDGKPRELHVEEAADAIDYSVLPDYRNVPVRRDAQRETIVTDPHFTVERITLREGDPCEIASDGTTFHVIIPVDGPVQVEAGEDRLSLPRCTSALIPACAPAVRLSGTADLLLSYI